MPVLGDNAVMGDVRIAMGAACMAVALAGCAASEPAPPRAGTSPAGDPSAKPHAKRPSPKASDKSGTKRNQQISRKDGGARADVPDEVILRELARTAERIAQNYKAPTTPAPADIDPDTNRGLGYQLMIDFGFPADQWKYLDGLWQRESGWNHLAENPSSGAYGIPQSLPAHKMSVIGPDWRSNPETQIRWGLAYIAARYGTPQGAWQHSERTGWY